MSEVTWVEMTFGSCSKATGQTGQFSWLFWRNRIFVYLTCVCLWLGVDFSGGIWVFPKIGVPQNGWFIIENPIKMDDFGGKNPLFSETPIWQQKSCWKTRELVFPVSGEPTGSSRALLGSMGFGVPKKPWWTRGRDSKRWDSGSNMGTLKPGHDQFFQQTFWTPLRRRIDLFCPGNWNFDFDVELNDELERTRLTLFDHNLTMEQIIRPHENQQKDRGPP